MFNISYNTFKELTRNKVLYLILFFAILLIIFSLALASLSMGQTEKIVLDFWLAMIEIFWLVSVIFIWSQLIFKEIDGKTIYLILSKPISRYEFILWKFIWFAMILACIIFFQSVFFVLLLWYSKFAITSIVLWSIFFIYIKLLVLFTIILFFSTFISSILSILLTIIVYIISHWITSILDMANHGNNYAIKTIWKVLYVIFPNFEALNIKETIMSPIVVSSSYIALNLSYAIIYSIIILGFTIIIFNRKTFEN